MKISRVVVLLLCICIGALAFKVYTQSQVIKELRNPDAPQVAADKRSAGLSVSPAVEPSPQPAAQNEEVLSQNLAAKEREVQQLKSQLSDMQKEAELSETKPEDPDKKKFDSASMMANVRKMMKDPATREVMRAQQKLSLDMVYGALFDDMLATPDEIEELKDLLVDKQMEQVELMQDFSPADVGKMEDRSSRIAAINDEYNEKIRLAIGEHNYETYREYEQTLPDRMQVNVFKQQLSSSDRLTGRQEEDLIHAMYDVRTSFNASFRTDQEQPPDPTKLTEEVIEEKVGHLATLRDSYINRARDILSESQLAQFEKSTEQWHSMQEMGIRMSQQMSDESQDESKPEEQHNTNPS
jgi:hypothetical protein